MDAIPFSKTVTLHSVGVVSKNTNALPRGMSRRMLNFG